MPGLREISDVLDLESAFRRYRWDVGVPVLPVSEGYPETRKDGEETNANG
jgi:hypothetical protein